MTCITSYGHPSSVVIEWDRDPVLDLVVEGGCTVFDP